MIYVLIATKYHTSREICKHRGTLSTSAYEHHKVVLKLNHGGGKNTKTAKVPDPNHHHLWYP